MRSRRPTGDQCEPKSSTILQVKSPSAAVGDRSGSPYGSGLSGCTRWQWSRIRRTGLRRFLVDEAWPQVPVELRGGLTKREREAILGYGPEGV
jgi:hypothetical protein